MIVALLAARRFAPRGCNVRQATILKKAWPSNAAGRAG
jgi:hypothetical protein